MTKPLVRSLFDGPLDIVGDVHGEIDDLRPLLQHLGYNDDGQHPDGRRLIFVGDLTDRGPNSPAVVDLVQHLVESERAQCVLGNHDLNILLDRRKCDNGWFFGEEFQEKDGYVVRQELADDSVRERVLAFFRTLPLALERVDLRVVHACWDDGMMSFVRDSSSVLPLYHEHRDRIAGEIRGRTDLDDIDEGLWHQNQNPVKLLTSGPEERSAEPIEASGKTRYERRVEWWREYRDDVCCVFGHYSRADGEHRSGHSAFCVDYGVGKRARERRAGKAENLSRWLAAIRFPERVVVFENGLTQQWRD